MDSNNFIEKFAEAIECETSSSLGVDTIFRELDEWSSLSYLSVIAMLDEEYDIQIEEPEFKQLKTISDIIKYIEEHK